MRRSRRCGGRGRRGGGEGCAGGRRRGRVGRNGRRGDVPTLTAAGPERGGQGRPWLAARDTQRQQHGGGRQHRSADGRRRCAGDVARHYGRGEERQRGGRHRVAGLVGAIGSHRQGQHPDEHQADGADSHDQQPSTTGRRLRRRARQLGWVAPRTLVRGQRSVRHRIANLLMATVSRSVGATTAKGRSGASGGTDGETAPAYDACAFNAPPTDEWLALSDDALPVAGRLRVGRACRLRCRRAVLAGPCATTPTAATASSNSSTRPTRPQRSSRFAEIASSLRERWPAVGRVVLLHRTGALAVGECAVVAVVSAPHRDRGVRGRSLRDRRAEGLGTDLEARDVGRRCRLGYRRTAHQRPRRLPRARDLGHPRRGRRRDRSGADRPRPSPQHRRRGDVPASHRRAVARGPAPGGQPGAAARRRASDASAEPDEEELTRWPVTWPSTSAPPTRSST